MRTLRAPRAASRYFRERDKDSPISESFIRRLINDGEIPVVSNGSKKLVSIESIEQYIEKQLRDD